MKTLYVGINNGCHQNELGSTRFVCIHKDEVLCIHDPRPCILWDAVLFVMWQGHSVRKGLSLAVFKSGYLKGYYSQ